MKSHLDKNKASDDAIVKKVRETIAKKNTVIQDLKERLQSMESALEDAKAELIRAKDTVRSHDNLIEALDDILSEDASQND